MAMIKEQLELLERNVCLSNRENRIFFPNIVLNKLNINHANNTNVCITKIYIVLPKHCKITTVFPGSMVDYIL